MPSFLLRNPNKTHRAVVPSLLLLLSILILLFYTRYHRSPTSRTAPRGSRNVPAAARQLFLSLSDGANASIAAHLRALTLRPHLAGTPAAAPAADYVLRHLRSAGFRAVYKDFFPLLSYPLSSSLSLLSADGTLIKPLSLAEPADPAGRTVPPYHAYSPSGSAALAPPVYVNYGREEDYQTLRRLGVDLRGCVAVVRRGAGYRGVVVERAAEKGAAAVLVFGAPDGGVERGSVLLGGPGDPLTPGWAAEADGERLGAEEEEARRRFPRVPSMPISLETAAEILSALGGPAPPHEWVDGMGFDAGGVGAGPVLFNFTYQEDRKLATIRNVFGVIRGREEPDRYVILGNHRDAWTYGAVDPNSGTAALLNIVHRYGVLLRSGWRPRRTIIVCSWDAEEFGMIGSTEWVEQNVADLELKAVAYLNVDCAVQGPGFFADATPQLDKLLVNVAKQVNDPDLKGMTVYQTWVSANGGINIERLARANSDFSAFLHHAGVPSIDLYYGKEFPVYHTAHDSYGWMEKHGDPLFHRHVAIAEIWGLLGLHLADDPILPFDYLSYAAQLQKHTSALLNLLDDGMPLLAMNISISELSAAASEAQEEAKELHEIVNEEDSELKRQAFNDRLILAERGFLEAEGLSGRRWFKHLVYAPPEDIDSKLTFFPGIADAISRSRQTRRSKQSTGIQHEIWRLTRAIHRVVSALRGDLV